MAAVAPLAIKLGSMAVGAWLGKKKSGASKEQKAAMQGTQQAGQQLNQITGPLMQTGMGMARQGAGDLGAAGGYYRNILSSRQAARESLAPEMTTALDFYRGAEGRAKRTMRGGSRDLALAELSRQRVGQLAGMLPAARRSAAEGLTGTGGTAISGGTALTGQGAQSAANAADVQSRLFQQGTDIRQQQGQAGKTWGNMLYDAAQMLPWGKGGGGEGGEAVPPPKPVGFEYPSVGF